MALNRKIAYIDLTTGDIETKPIPLEVRKKFLGGRGLDHRTGDTKTDEDQHTYDDATQRSADDISSRPRRSCAAATG